MKAMILKPFFLLTLFLFAAGNSWSQTPDQLFQKGIMKEEGEGSLKEAIELYKSVADNTKADKVLRAKALYQMGNCYEKLGQQEARNIYEKLVANYTDPQELVANAKRKLNNLNAGQPVLPKTGLSMRQINDASVIEGPFSPDGKYVVLRDSISLFVKNLQTGEKCRITKKGKWDTQEDQQEPDLVIWSPDSKSLAYCWTIHDETYSKYSAEIHIVGRDGSGDRILVKDTNYVIPRDWSSDSRNLLIARWSKTIKLSVLSIKEGKEKEITTLEDITFPLGAQFSDDGNFVVFTAKLLEKSKAEKTAESHSYDIYNNNIYSVPVNGGVIQELVSFKEREEGPWAVHGTNKVIFISTHSGEKGLWAITIENGKLKGEPEILKTGLDESSRINSVLENGTVLISSDRWNPDFFYARLDLEKNNVTYIPFDIARGGSMKMVKTIWSPSLSKVAVMAADPLLHDQYLRMKLIGFDLRTREKQEVSTDLITFHLFEWTNPRWTPDEKSVLIKAQWPKGIFKIDFSTQSTSEYLMGDKTWSEFEFKRRWLQFSPDGKIQYFASTEEDFKSNPTKLIARSAETGGEQIIRQFDKMPDKFFLSPDGNQIAVKYDNSVLVFNADGSKEKTILKDLDKNWGTLLGWSSDSKSVLVQKPGIKETWSIWLQPLDGQNSREAISANKLKPFFGSSGLLLHYVGGETYLSMQNGKKIYELWAIENIVQK